MSVCIGISLHVFLPGGIANDQVFYVQHVVALDVVATQLPFEQLLEAAHFRAMITTNRFVKIRSEGIFIEVDGGIEHAVIGIGILQNLLVYQGLFHRCFGAALFKIAVLQITFVYLPEIDSNEQSNDADEVNLFEFSSKV